MCFSFSISAIWPSFVPPCQTLLAINFCIRLSNGQAYYFALGPPPPPPPPTHKLKKKKKSRQCKNDDDGTSNNNYFVSPVPTSLITQPFQ